MLQIREYVRQGGRDDEELIEGLKDLDFREEFLVVIVEDDASMTQVHFHKMNTVGMKKYND